MLKFVALCFFVAVFGQSLEEGETNAMELRDSVSMPTTSSVQLGALGGLCRGVAGLCVDTNQANACGKFASATNNIDAQLINGACPKGARQVKCCTLSNYGAAMKNFKAHVRPNNKDISRLFKEPKPLMDLTIDELYKCYPYNNHNDAWGNTPKLKSNSIDKDTWAYMKKTRQEWIEPLIKNSCAYKLSWMMERCRVKEWNPKLRDLKADKPMPLFNVNLRPHPEAKTPAELKAAPRGTVYTRVSGLKSYFSRVFVNRYLWFVKMEGTQSPSVLRFKSSKWTGKYPSAVMPGKTPLDTPGIVLFLKCTFSPPNGCCVGHADVFKARGRNLKQKAKDCFDACYWDSCTRALMIPVKKTGSSKKFFREEEAESFFETAKKLSADPAEHQNYQEDPEDDEENYSQFEETPVEEMGDK